MTQPLTTVGLLGAGTVGSAFLELLEGRDGVAARVHKVLVRDPDKPRRVARDRLCTDPEEALDADVVVELMGGTELAGDLTLRALRMGKRVVTANKAVLAERWDEFAPFLREGRLYFEAAVMAGTPAVGPLTTVLRGSKPLELHAILNGTCSYILGELEGGADYHEALAEAQRLGYAEADPSLDVEGVDAAHKLTLLARLMFDPHISWDAVRADTRGISGLTPALVLEAMEDGGRVRLVGSVYPEEGRWRVSVRPVYLPATHALAGAASNRNGFVFRGDAVGEVMVAGAGAGAASTASAVLADLMDAAAGRPGPAPLAKAAAVPADYRAPKLGEIKLKSDAIKDATV